MSDLPVRPDGPPNHQDEPTYSTSDIGILYESYVASLLVHAGYRVRTTPKSGDGGGDLLVYHPSDNARPFWCVQCKNWGKPPGMEAVQQAFTASHLYKARRAVVVAPNPLTSNARARAEDLGVLSLCIGSNSWEEGALVIPPPEEVQPDVPKVRERWSQFVEALESERSATQVPWACLTAQRLQTSAVVESAKDLVPGPFNSIDARALRSLGDLLDVLGAVQAHETLMFTNVEWLERRYWEMVLSALVDRTLHVVSGSGPSARQSHLDLPTFALITLVTEPVQIPVGELAQAISLTGRELLALRSDVRSTERSALRASQRFETERGRVVSRAEAVAQYPHTGGTINRHHIRLYWEHSSYRTTWGFLQTEYVDHGEDMVGVDVDAATGTVMSVATEGRSPNSTQQNGEQDDPAQPVDRDVGPPTSLGSHTSSPHRQGVGEISAPTESRRRLPLPAVAAVLGGVALLAAFIVLVAGSHRRPPTTQHAQRIARPAASPVPTQGSTLVSLRVAVQPTRYAASRSAPRYPTSISVMVPDRWATNVAAYGVAGLVVLGPSAWAGQGTVAADGSRSIVLRPQPKSPTGRGLFSYTDTGACVRCAWEASAPYFAWVRAHWSASRIPGSPPNPLTGLVSPQYFITPQILRYQPADTSSGLQVNGVAYTAIGNDGSLTSTMYPLFENATLELPASDHGLATVLLEDFLTRNVEYHGF